MRYKQLDNVNRVSKAEKLRDQLAKAKGKYFKRSGFFAVDQEKQVLEKPFPETREVVQVHLNKYGKVQQVYLLKD